MQAVHVHAFSATGALDSALPGSVLAAGEGAAAAAPGGRGSGTAVVVERAWGEGPNCSSFDPLAYRQHLQSSGMGHLLMAGGELPSTQTLLVECVFSFWRPRLNILRASSHSRPRSLS